MTAYALVTLDITQPETFAAYREVAGAALEKHGAAPLLASQTSEVIEGDRSAPTVSVILTFPDREAAKTWINDPELANVHALRRASGSSQIILM